MVWDTLCANGPFFLALNHIVCFQSPLILIAFNTECFTVNGWASFNFDVTNRQDSTWTQEIKVMSWFSSIFLDSFVLLIIENGGEPESSIAGGSPKREHSSTWQTPLLEGGSVKLIYQEITKLLRRVVGYELIFK